MKKAKIKLLIQNIIIIALIIANMVVISNWDFGMPEEQQQYYNETFVEEIEVAYG